MFLRLIPVVAGTLIMLSLAPPGSATVEMPRLSRQSAPAASATSAAPSFGRRLVRTGDARGSVVLTRPAGCSVSGALSFNGGGLGNVAGGSAASVASGHGNEACDPDTIAGDGTGNILGGDGASYSAAIVSGLTTSVEGSAGAIIGAGQNNIISDLPPYGNSNLSAIAAGEANSVGSPDSFIGSGQLNSIVPPALKLATGNSPSSFIGAGYGNSIVSDYSSITGGLDNAVTSEYTFIGGGQNNTISANGSVGGSTGAAYSTIAGGLGNTIGAIISSGARYGFIGAGHGNVLNAFNGVIAGGESNVATGDFSAVPGGLNNYAAGTASFAAGSGSQAVNPGAFVWSDGATGATTLSSTAPNQFLARAAGGFYLYSSANLKSGVKLAPGSGSWSTLSDRASKTAIETVDDSQILAKIASLPVSEWSYSAQGNGVRHLGPMAQDFRAAFGLGEDDRHISTVDEEGVALAAVKALQAESVTKDRQIAELRAARRSDAKRFASLEKRLDALEARLSATQ